jgi:cell division protein FtsB
MMKTRRVRYMTLFVVLVVISVAFFATNRGIFTTIQETDKKIIDARLSLSESQKQKLDLEAELSVAGTDAYIENEARTRYGYLKPGELRFVITNPEALYSTGGDTPDLQVVQEGDKP